MSLLYRLANHHSLPAWVASKRLYALFAVELMVIAMAALTAFLLRFEFSIPVTFLSVMAEALPVWLIVKIGVFTLFHTHQQSLRYLSLADVLRLLGANVLGSVISFPVLLALDCWVPRSVCAIDLILCFLFTVGWRIGARLIGELGVTPPSRRQTQRAVIYGAGKAGVALLRELQQNTELPYEVCGFVDDAKNKVGLSIYNRRVLGTGADLSEIARKYAVELALIAVPSATGVVMNRILHRCHAAQLRFKTIPSLLDTIAGTGLARQIRDVNVEDLLGRSPVNLDGEKIASRLRGKTVLVTGAAGSIGSELCRQVARFQPAAIVGYDIAETGLFHVEQEMRQNFPHVPFFPEVASIQNRHRLADVFSSHRPSIVYHAAAYKHVPLMEAHAFEAVANNVFGTVNVVKAAQTYGAADFVMISSDKAVRPTNVMGATKRVAELVVRALGTSRLKCVSVRFGNVLGSNGSVVPSFKQQIAKGGPVTVTHPEMRRYFMTIPEACQLVLQSSSMGAGSEIFVLDMGEPVKIADLAHNLIVLSGLRPGEDVQIEYTGIRPGEKLYEELSAIDEDTRPTYQEKIKVFAGPTIPWAELREQLARLERAGTARDLCDLVEALQDLVPEYQPSPDLRERASRGNLIAMSATVAGDRLA